MGIDTSDRLFDLCGRLRIAVLGRAACTFGDCCSDDGFDSGVHGAVGDHFSANAETHGSTGDCVIDWDRWGGGSDEPLAESWWCGDRQDGCGGAACWVVELGGGFGADARAAASGVKGVELWGTDAGWR